MARPLQHLRWLALLGVAGSFQAHAVSFELGDIRGNFDTQLSIGATVRMQDPNVTNFGQVNGGEARTANTDDGNIGIADGSLGIDNRDRNFERGDFTSAAVASSHELLARWGDYAFFTRFRFDYDVRNRGSASRLGPRGESRIGRNNELLDLFVQGRFRLFDRALRVRLGRQVVSWGESTFIQNGINVINAIDVSNLRTPGSRLRDALTPSPMAHISYSLTRNLSMEALYITSFDETQIDPRGAFFSTNDFASSDGNRAFLGFGRTPDDPAAAGAQWVLRGDTRFPENDREQYGLALRYFAPQLNNTDFGFYYLRYASRVPLVSSIRGGASANTDPVGGVDGIQEGSARYFVEYPDNIDLFGISFNTLGPMGIALQGEYSYRSNLPLQLSAVELILATLNSPDTDPGTRAAVSANNIDTARGIQDPQTGDEVRGWERVSAHQFQMTATQAFGPSFGASQWVVLGEAGVNYLDLPDGFLFNGGGVALPSQGTQQRAQDNTGAPVAPLADGGTQFDGFATSTSWGYRIVSRLDYENVFGSWQVSPRLIFSHDVNGVGPNFVDGRKAVITGVSADYLRTWRFDISYTTFFGGKIFRGEDRGGAFATHSNANIDRDFLSFDVSYSF